ncbi:protein phosphatase 1 regulatory subunit 15B-like [Heptranchias perlo]|uniref:protein phosphatase 1 regulatory subunit 15B-like n=1 Tax=Heptranchias perlo TaxID=212740 RepID=UPI00355A6E70
MPVRMITGSPCDRLPTAMSFHQPWITNVASTLMELCLSLVSELLSASRLYLRLSAMSLAEMVRMRRLCHQPHQQKSQGIAGMGRGETDCYFKRPSPAVMSQSGSVDMSGQHTACVSHHSLPDLIPCQDGWLLGEGQVDTPSDHQGEMASTCTNPFILSMISVSMDQEDEQAPSDWLSDTEESDAESNDWSIDGEEIDECDANDLWDSFFEHDPYNPMNFSASTGQQTQNNKGEEGSSGQFETEELENDKLWDSCLRSIDPIDPMNFSACTATRLSNDKGAKGQISSSAELSEGTMSEGTIDCPGPLQISDRRLGEDCSAPIGKQDTPETKGKRVKKVRFSPVVELHPMIVWDFAYRAARKGPWEQHARDRCRFQRRIAETEAAIGYCLEQRHRHAVRAKLYSD